MQYSLLRGGVATALAAEGQKAEEILPRLDEGLVKLGYEAFRPGQREAVETLLTKNRLLLVAPTGGGKSLTYQLPASLMEGTSLVVSPLIALMQDQVSALTERGIAATYLSSTLDSRSFRTRLSAIAQGKFKLVYVAPERLSFPGFRSMLQDLAPPLIAIDEAHCISEWGHDFRPEYHRIGEVLDICPSARLLACTATATPVVRDEILSKLSLPPQTPQLVRGFARPNLSLRVHELLPKRRRTERVLEYLTSAVGSSRDPQGSAIIYAPTRASTEETARLLTDQGWDAEAYHAGLAPDRRDRIQASFRDRALDIVVATNAFGMGIDRADVRAVIHLSPPGSLEAYYQEVGRAGRDGEPAVGVLFTQSNDFPLRRRLIERDGETESEIVEHKWGMFLELMRWAEGGSCRHDAILRYFGDEAEALSGCGECDVCEQLDTEPEDDAEHVSLTVRKALSGVARIHGRFGLGAAVKLLKGKSDNRLERAALDTVSTFGVLKQHPEAWLQKLLGRCVTAGWVDFHGDEHPVAVLTEPGIAAMRNEIPIRLRLPPYRRERAPTPARGSSRGSVALEATTPRQEEIFEALRAVRLELAREQGAPPYIVASDRTLRDIAMLEPRTLEDLKLAHGIGPAKAERYGAALLRAVADATRS